MKFRTLLLLLIPFLINDIYAQNKPNKEKIGSVGGYQMGHVDCVMQNNLYVITYENQNDVRVNDYAHFSIKAEDFDDVYNTILEGFKTIPNDEIHIPTISGYVSLEYTKFLGKISMRFTQSKKKGALGISYSTWYSQKDMEKLFGKK